MSPSAVIEPLVQSLLVSHKPYRQQVAEKERSWHFIGGSSTTISKERLSCDLRPLQALSPSPTDLQACTVAGQHARRNRHQQPQQNRSVRQRLYIWYRQKQDIPAGCDPSITTALTLPYHTFCTHHHRSHRVTPSPTPVDHPSSHTPAPQVPPKDQAAGAVYAAGSRLPHALHTSPNLPCWQTLCLQQVCCGPVYWHCQAERMAVAGSCRSQLARSKPGRMGGVTSGRKGCG